MTRSSNFQICFLFLLILSNWDAHDALECGILKVMVIPTRTPPIVVRVPGQCIEVSNNQPTVHVGRNIISLYEPHSMLPLMRAPPGRAHHTHPDGLSEHDIQEWDGRSQEMKRSNFEAQDKIEHLKFDRTALQARLREQQEAREPLLQDSDIDVDLLEDL